MRTRLRAPVIGDIIMHIAVIAPSDKSFIQYFLPNIDFDALPNGYSGAPFIGSLISEFLRLGHVVTAITTTEAKNDDYTIKRFKCEHFEWIVVPRRPHSVRPNGFKVGRTLDMYAYEIKELAKAISSVNCDFVHAHWSYEFASAALKCKKPYLITVHDNAFKVFGFYKNIYRLSRLFLADLNLHRAKYVSTVSPYMEPYVAERCKNIKIIPNPIEIPLYENIQNAISLRVLNLSKPRILMINNGWDKRKNGENGIKAFSLLQKKINDIELHLFGSGSESETHLHKFAVESGISKNIYFHGFVSNSEIKHHLQNGHILLHTSLEESFGVVLIEAMSVGMPVIGGAKSGAVPWVIADNDLLTNVTNVELIADKIYQVLSNKDNYIDKSKSCYENVKIRFSVENVTKQYMGYFNEIKQNFR